MKKYFQEFAEEQANLIKLDSLENQAYIFILWSISEAIDDFSGRLSDSLKDKFRGLEEALDISQLEFTQMRHTLNTQILDNEDNPTESREADIGKLKSIQIKNFKGFHNRDNADLGCKIDVHSHKTIIFAPNGGGKTSFCEAIEYELTGSIKEARRRGYAATKLKDYCYNGANPPVINIEASSANDIRKSIEFFNTCFIEKNRLQEFAFLGSKDTNTQEKDVIALLFGLEDLQELISKFVLPNSFKLDDFKVTRAKDKLQALRQQNQENLTRKSTRGSDIEAKHEALYKAVKEVPEGAFSNDWLAKIKDQQKQEIARLEVELKEITALKLDEAELDTAIEKHGEFTQVLEGYKAIEHRLQNDKGEVDFFRLYQAILSVKGEDLTECPACKTPLDHVQIDPFDNAEKELVKLKSISKLEADKKDFQEKIDDIYDSFITPALREIILNLDKISGSWVEIKERINEFRELAKNKSKLELIERFFDQSFTLLLEPYKLAIHYVNQEFVRADKIRKQKEDELAKTREVKAQTELLEQDLRTLEREMERIDKEIESYAYNESQLVLKIRQEDTFNSFISAVESSYTKLYSELQGFKAQKEEEKFDSVQQDATHYYRLINKHDTESEVVESICFRKEQNNYRIRLKVQTEEVEQDAFQYLSEGHTRSLGLALMLAVAKNKPFLIFDDVVNAIDSEHRANIIDMILTEPTLKDQQMIITTHDRLFWERFCDRADKNKYYSYIFRKDELLGITPIDYDLSFEKKIEDSLSSYDIRQALLYCRIWFETLVVDYCLSNEIEITGKFSDREKEKNNLLKISLEKMYKEVREQTVAIPLLHETYNRIYSALPIWKGLNESNHSIDEENLNYSHASTSDEVSTIFADIQNLELLLFPDRLRGKYDLLNKNLLEVNSRLVRKAQQLANTNFVERADPAVVEKTRKEHQLLVAKKESIKSRLVYFTEELGLVIDNEAT